MWIRNTSSYPDDEVRNLVKLACDKLDMRRVCVNVKGGSQWGGYAYDGVPTISNAPYTAEYLVTIRLPKHVLPETMNERKSSRFPVYRVACWRELLVVIAAHEAKHIDQFRSGTRHSEVRCEHFARFMLARFRAA